MSKYKILNLFVLLTLVLSLFMSGSDQVLAQNQNPPGQANKPEKKDKITQADREAAAARAAEGGFTLDAMAMAMPAIPGEAPRYFSHPNYANSPLPIVTTDSVTGEIISIDGGIRKFVDTDRKSVV